MIKTSFLSILLNNSERTIQRWKKENRPIIKLLDKYFTDQELEEFLETGKILNFDNIASHLNLSNLCIKNLSNNLIFLFDNNHKYSHLHPLYVFFDFINKSKSNFNNVEFISDNTIFYDIFLNEYCTFVINSKIDPVGIKKLLDIDLDVIYILCRHKNSLNQLFNLDQQLKVFLIFYYELQNIETQNKDFFIKYFNLAVNDYTNYNHMMVGIEDLEKDKNKINILNNINDIIIKLRN